MPPTNEQYQWRCQHDVDSKTSGDASSNRPLTSCQNYAPSFTPSIHPRTFGQLAKFRTLLKLVLSLVEVPHMQVVRSEKKHERRRSRALGFIQ